MKNFLHQLFDRQRGQEESKDRNKIREKNCFVLTCTPSLCSRGEAEATFFATTVAAKDGACPHTSTTFVFSLSLQHLLLKYQFVCLLSFARSLSSLLSALLCAIADAQERLHYCFNFAFWTKSSIFFFCRFDDDDPRLHFQFFFFLVLQKEKKIGGMSSALDSSNSKMS